MIEALTEGAVAQQQGGGVADGEGHETSPVRSATSIHDGGRHRR